MLGYKLKHVGASRPLFQRRILKITFFSIGWLCRKVYNNFVSLYCIHHVGELVVDLPEVTADVDVSLVHKYINFSLIVS